MFSGKMGALLEEIASTPVTELVPEPPKPSGETGKDFWAGVITVSGEDTIRASFEKLVKNNILSAPVRSGLHSSAPRTYHGFVDMLDLVTFVVNKMDLESDSELEVSDVQAKLGEVQETFNHTFINDLESGKTHRSSLASFPLNENYSLYTVLELLAYSGSHRIPILNDHQTVSNIITSTMMLRYVKSLSSLFPSSLKGKKVAEFATKEVVSVKHEVKAIAACKVMADASVNGLAVVDDSGVLVEVFSVKDLRGIGINAEQIWRLFVPIIKYKTQEESSSKTPSAPVTVKKDATFTEVLDLFVKHRIHHVFVVDDEGHPINQITPACLLSAALSARD